MADNVRKTDTVSEILNRYDRARSRKQESDGLRQEAGQYSWPEAKSDRPIFPRVSRSSLSAIFWSRRSRTFSYGRSIGSIDKSFSKRSFILRCPFTFVCSPLTEADNYFDSEFFSALVFINAKFFKIE